MLYYANVLAINYIYLLTKKERKKKKKRRNGGKGKRKKIGGKRGKVKEYKIGNISLSCFSVYHWPLLPSKKKSEKEVNNFKQIEGGKQFFWLWP